ncbi:MAG: tRNA (adenosine(37)-N6)-threonylcarbamoyltransferase complex transferase subunit TsaD [Clostridiales Family XIII bacterium]|jgi:N6-L-threonylcarbamoyladenine synthase|nr:tRNA (adenosine(37)-N6)-threonylcarbamoyltransferase complex transferase subunit TsaD [Clostridiales Family XIII bacterium]
MTGAGIRILGIETSCDETAASVTLDGRTVLSNVIASQVDIHKAFGGVVPEIASRHHLCSVNGVVSEALREAAVLPGGIDAVAVTEGPGLVGAVLIGLATAKAMAFALGKPLVGVHHIRGHICAALIEHKDLEPPFLALVVSGGHTSLIDVRGLSGRPGEMAVLGSTRDDAVGEAYDKVARVLGLGYPGGPKIDALAKGGDPCAARFKRVMLEEGSLDFSFSGLKTGVLNYVNSKRQAGLPVNEADVAAGFQQAAIDVLSAKTRAALKLTGRKTLALAGGVASNSALRARMREDAEYAGIRLCIPSPVYCTDNAAMIACAGYCKFAGGGTDGLDLDAHATLPL